MFDAFYVAATGMQAQQQSLNSIANNLANVSTNGFKKARVSFQDLMVQMPAARGEPVARLSANVGDVLRGVGVGVADTRRLFDAGELKKTESAMDLAIVGDGFFEVLLEDGGTGFSRGGTLTVDVDGVLRTQAGHKLLPGISVPQGTKALSIAADGTVFAKSSDSSEPQDLGRLELVRFNNPSGLGVHASGVYVSSDLSGSPIAVQRGEEGAPTVAQGFLEGSNVKVIDEMVNLMLAQRAYEASVKVLQVSDEMLAMSNNLRK